MCWYASTYLESAFYLQSGQRVWTGGGAVGAGCNLSWEKCGGGGGEAPVQVTGDLVLLPLSPRQVQGRGGRASLTSP